MVAPITLSDLLIFRELPSRIHLPLGASTAGALVLVLVGKALQPGRHFLFGLHQDVQQVLSDVAVLVIVEGCGQT